MTSEIGGQGTVGVAFETTVGTFVAPTKWIPIRSESLQLVEDKIYRMNIRATADRTGAVQGYTHVEGDIEFEVTSDVLLYFLYAARMTPTKTGAVAPYTYTFVGAGASKVTTATGPTNRKTLSLLITRGGNPRGFVGMAVGQMVFTLDNGMLICTASMVGTNEASQSTGTPTWPTLQPYGPGKITLEIPTATARADMDTFTLTINDNLVPANRLNGQRNAAYENWGEREITLTCEADFDTMTDWNAFQNQTFQAITVKAINDAVNDSVVALLNAGVADSYSYPLAGLGEINRASLAFHSIYNTSDALTLTVKTSESIT